MLTLIWAQSSNGVIGAGGTMPWHCPEDLKHFKNVTKDSVIVMGRKTWQSLPVKPLPNRFHYVISRTPIDMPNVEVRDDFHHLMMEYHALPEGHNWYIIGGGQLFDSAMEYADQLIVTLFDFVIEGDTFAPNIDEHIWTLKDTYPLEGTFHQVQKWVRV